jgi:hypothetical protein
MGRARQIIDEAIGPRAFLRRVGKLVFDYAFNVQIITGIDDTVVWSDEVRVQASTDKEAELKVRQIAMDQVEFDDRIDPRLNIELLSKDEVSHE